ncbi:aspartate aminotransferase family protein [Phycicoccus sp. CSK15P-2]|uniref:pyridoxal phosphate-dependent decarboxylase family protein n=1 Tax=Phycicoccus sp. CSK15P-2 TaxID=2807627 RepID=UPI00194E0F2E|nr:aminotransferase class V-fold PLP-dependent enzyme [Phycicoccus sp. CSK15P-2]MBM6403016.1 aspartate aminotransferase family protein [Phycicoccus sp. CSK15P-2]
MTDPVPAGPSPDEVLAELRALQAADLPTHGGRTLAYVYDSGLAEADALGREALALFASSNGLDPTAFPSLLRMENDLVALAAGLLDGPAGAVGSVTSGGTESILLAVLAARKGASHVDHPSMVLPSSAHAAFHKAAAYLGVRPVVVDVDPGTLRADPRAMASAVDQTTVLVVASAPSYAHGVVDPVADIAALAAARGVRCHVDACIGGWVLPFLGDVPPWTFAVDGVTSISVDLHKYAYTPKGVSLLLHRDTGLRRGHLFASAAWPGYTMLNSTMQSTRSGGPLAAAWAVSRHLGTAGYARLAARARTATLEVTGAVRELEGLRVVAEPDSTLLALATDGSCDVFTIADEMLARGWYVQPQMAFGDVPPTLHLTFSAATAASVPELVEALRDATAAARAAGPARVDPGLAGTLGGLDAATLDDAAFAGLLGAAGLAGEDGGLALPERMAPVNALLDACPAELREELLVGVLDRLSRPTGTATSGRAPEA